jgi:membrane protein YqaA with SNARE-associated domain
MNWLDLILIAPLAVLCNTILPVPFDPVLIFFASRQSVSGACVLALIASLCAAVAGAADVTLVRHLRPRTPERWLAILPAWLGSKIYILAFLFALLPLPFTVVRFAALRHPPKMIPFQIVVMLGRLPRYLLTVLLWRTLPHAGMV